MGVDWWEMGRGWGDGSDRKLIPFVIAMQMKMCFDVHVRSDDILRLGGVIVMIRFYLFYE